MARGCRPAARGGAGGAGGGEHLEPPFEHLNLENNIPETNKQTNKQTNSSDDVINLESINKRIDSNGGRLQRPSTTTNETIVNN